MAKIINLNDYREKLKDIDKLEKIELTREERLEANKSLFYDDELILQMMLEETDSK